jgi:dTDP-4-dehydrorhamnose reductase
MSKIRVFVLGATGLMGSMLLDYLERDPRFAVYASARDEDMLERGSIIFPKVSWHRLSLETTEPNYNRLSLLPAVDWIINCISVSQMFLSEDSIKSREQALFINALFPQEIAKLRASRDCKVIQITGDGVFSGLEGNYLEGSPHDSADTYGKSLSLGERVSPNVYLLRASILGPEPGSHKYLLEQIRHQLPGATIHGAKNIKLSCVSTLHVAKICHGLILNPPEWSGVQHIVPDGAVTEYEAMVMLANVFGRDDLEILSVDTPTRIDRTLGTSFPERNEKLWQLAGYKDHAPHLSAMFHELQSYPYRFIPGRSGRFGKAINRQTS